MEIQEIKSALESIKDQVKTGGEQARKEVEEKLSTINESLKGFSKTSDIEELKTVLKGIQDHNDRLDIKLQGFDKKRNEVKSFNEVYRDALESKHEEILDTINSGRKFRTELKAFTLSGSLTGDAQASYNPQNAVIKPAAKVNVRDLIPTTVSPTGLYVTYREGTLTGGAAKQTEGAAKAAINSTLTEVKTIANYIAGVHPFSKQALNSLPFLQGTLQRILMREFFLAENTLFNTALAAGTGSSTSAATVDVEQLIDWVANLEAANYTASVIVVNPKDWASIAKTANLNASVVLSYNPISNQFELNGIPVVKASWCTIDKAIVMDVDYVERVEVEGLRLEFSEHDVDNFQKNMITARIECLEEINIMDPAAIVYGDFGNIT